MDDTDTSGAVIQKTITWLEKAVIGLNLCPFAKAVHTKQQIHYIVSEASEPDALLEQLIEALWWLVDADPDEVETILLIHPQVLQDFYDYNDFLSIVDHALVKFELDGVLQVASFHPEYQFADADENDISNYTNRSPYPMLHILRESSVERAVKAIPDAANIYDNNKKTLEKLGLNGWQCLFE